MSNNVNFKIFILLVQNIKNKIHRHLFLSSFQSKRLENAEEQSWRNPAT